VVAAAGDDRTSPTPAVALRDFKSLSGQGSRAISRKLLPADTAQAEELLMDGDGRGQPSHCTSAGMSSATPADSNRLAHRELPY
jgi:hypothetical protein